MITSRKSLRAAGVATAGSALLLGSALVAAPASAAPTATRYAGDDRYATAAAAFRAATEATESTAVLAGGGDFPDALSANYLAGKLGTGTLLTRAATLSPVTLDTLGDKNVDTVYVVGGTTAVSNAVVTQLEAATTDDGTRITVRRVGGDNRYETNAEVNQAADAIAPAGTVQRTLVASGQGFADALAFGPVSYAAKVPLVLTPGGSLGAEARAQLEVRDEAPVDLAGSTASVSATTANQIQSIVGTAPNRLGGANRAATSVAIARSITASGSPYQTFFPTTSKVSLTNGSNFPDAVGGGPVAGQQGAPLLLARNATSSTEAEAYADSVTPKSADARVFAFGGADVLPDARVDAVLAELSPPAAPANG